ncbi:tetratricopeptide repeat protein [Rhodobacteraceae bacterium CCMM004]|nr:tetratricopeptide repeat protein [Rhodobacteraceae bacterium CCMM004]
MRIAAALTAALAVAACLPAGGQAVRGDRAGPPPGVARGTAVEGLTVGHRLMAAGEYELALKAFLRAAAEEGETAEVLSSLGTANLGLGRLGQAERLLRRAVEVDPGFAEAWNNLGVVLMERGHVAEAALVFRRAVALDSGESDDMRANLSLALAKRDDPTYHADADANFALVRQGTGSYAIRSPL